MPTAHNGHMTRLRAGRRTNLALLAVLTTAFVTGLVAMSGSGTGSAVVTALHDMQRRARSQPQPVNIFLT